MRSPNACRVLGFPAPTWRSTKIRPNRWSRPGSSWPIHEQGRIPLDPDGRLFPANQLVPPDLLPHRRYSLVVEPLYFQEKPIGFVVFELGPHEGDVYELLRGNLSSALQGAFLFREIQQARITAEKADRIKTRLLANVSHEMRTPLNIILGYTRNALETPNPYQSKLPEELITDLRHIQNNAEHQLRVINDLLDLSRAQIDELDLSLELMNPLPVLAESFHSLADQSNTPNVTWHLELPERLPVIRADPVRLRQILLNLLSNARKFTERGQVVLGAEVDTSAACTSGSPTPAWGFHPIKKSAFSSRS